MLINSVPQPLIEKPSLLQLFSSPLWFCLPWYQDSVCIFIASLIASLTPLALLQKPLLIWKLSYPPQFAFPDLTVMQCQGLHCCVWLLKVKKGLRPSTVFHQVLSFSWHLIRQEAILILNGLALTCCFSKNDLRSCAVELNANRILHDPGWHGCACQIQLPINNHSQTCLFTSSELLFDYQHSLAMTSWPYFTKFTPKSCLQAPRPKNL